MKKENNQNDKNKWQNILTGLIILIAITFIIITIIYTLNTPKKEDDKTISYTELIKQIADGNIEKVEMTTGKSYSKK